MAECGRSSEAKGAGIRGMRKGGSRQVYLMMEEGKGRWRAGGRAIHRLTGRGVRLQDDKVREEMNDTERVKDGKERKKEVERRGGKKCWR